MSDIKKKDKENIVTSNILNMKANLYVFEIQKKVNDKLDEDSESLEENITETTEIIETYEEVYGEEDPDFELPELEEDVKEQIIDEKITNINKQIWDAEMSIKVFDKVGNKDRKKKTEDRLVKLNKELSVWEDEKS